MDRFELDEGIKAEIRGRALGDGFIKLVQSARRGGRSIKTALRPVEIGGERKFQCETTEDGRVKVRNVDAADIAAELEAILVQKGPRDLHVMTAKGDLHLRVTRKGRALVSRSAEMNRSAEVRPHDRVKDVPLNRFDSSCMAPPICFIIDGLLVSESSLSICAASEMLEIGVFSSWVMLLMKSFLISESRFCRNTTTMVKMKVTSRMTVKTMAGIMKRILEKI